MSRLWQAVVKGPMTPVIADAGFAAQAAELLPPEPWDDETWSAWTNAVEDRDRAARARSCSCRCAWR